MHAGPAPDDLAKAPEEELVDLVIRPEPQMHLRACQRAVDGLLNEPVGGVVDGVVRSGVDTDVSGGLMNPTLPLQP